MEAHLNNIKIWIENMLETLLATPHEIIVHIKVGKTF